MSSEERQKRLEALNRWWRVEIPRRIVGGWIDDKDDDVFEEVVYALIAQAQKRWGVAITTARDYARVVFIANEAYLKSEQKKHRKSG